MIYPFFWLSMKRLLCISWLMVAFVFVCIMRVRYIVLSFTIYLLSKYSMSSISIVPV